MPPQARVTDITIGMGSHGSICCPHSLVGVIITGSPNVFTNSLPTAKAHSSVGVHSCPHCGCSMAIMGSPNVIINNLPAHRLGDLVTDFCGVSVTVTGSPNVMTNL